MAKLYIKYMVSQRCKMLVKEELKKVGIENALINLGEIELWEAPTEKQYDDLRSALLLAGLELMDDKKAILIEKIKNTIIEMVHFRNDPPKMNFSDYIEKNLNYDYTYLANLFSEIEGKTIEHFILLHKIERVKELIIYDELNLTQIAEKLRYSSVAHLSNQFKKNHRAYTQLLQGIKDKKTHSLRPCVNDVT